MVGLKRPAEPSEIRAHVHAVFRFLSVPSPVVEARDVWNFREYWNGMKWTRIHSILTPLRVFPSCTCVLINKLSPPSSLAVLLPRLCLSGGMQITVLCNTTTTTPAVGVTRTLQESSLALSCIRRRPNHGSGRHSQPCAQNSGVYFRKWLLWIQRREACECSPSGSACSEVGLRPGSAEMAKLESH